MIFPVLTLAATAVLTLIFLGLGINVTRHRISTRISLGDGSQNYSMGDEKSAPRLFVASRSLANFAEYVPLSLMLLLIIETVGAPHWAVATLAAMLVVGRLMHLIGMQLPAPNPFRAGGILLQWLFLLLGAIYGLLLVPGLL